MTASTGQRLQQLIDEYAKQTGQYPLSLRRFAQQFREAGGRTSHQALSKMVADHAVPKMETLQDLAMFFGTNICVFDANVEPERARVMGRLARLDETGQAAVAKLLDELDSGTRQ